MENILDMIFNEHAYKNMPCDSDKPILKEQESLRSELEATMTEEQRELLDKFALGLQLAEEIRNYE